MKIDASRATPAPAVVPAQKTPVSREAMREAIRRALGASGAGEGSGGKPKSALVDMLTAQASLETGSGSSMYNFNFGGIKGASPHGRTAVCSTHEVLGGRDVVVRDGFRAYESLDEGARDYVRTIKGRFKDAIAYAERGDAAGFAHALKHAGYYTASESDYANALSRLLRRSEATSSHATFAKRVGGAGFEAIHDSERAASPSDALARITDALGSERLAGAWHARHRHDDVEEDD